MSFSTLLLSVWMVAAPAAPASFVAPAAPVGYFCTTPGKTLRCERYAPDMKKHWWTQTTRIDAVQARQDGGLDVSFTMTIVSDKAKAGVKGPVNSKVLVRANGELVVDIAEAAGIAASQMFSAFNFESSGDPSVLPADAQVGDELKDIHAVVSWKGIKFTLDYTERRVLRREKLTVPAGTFDCIVVYEHKLEKAPLHKRDRITLTWYALGVGMVRHDTFFADGRLECTEQLAEIAP